MQPENSEDTPEAHHGLRTEDQVTQTDIQDDKKQRENEIVEVITPFDEQEELK